MDQKWLARQDKRARQEKAHQIWKERQARWAKKGMTFLEDLKAIEDQLLFDCTRVIVDCIAHGFAALTIGADAKDSSILETKGVRIEAECRAGLIQMLTTMAPDTDPASVIHSAYRWLDDRLARDDEDIVYAAWLLGRIEMDPLDTGPPIRKVWSHNIIWDMQKHKVVAIRLVGDDDKATPEDIVPI